MSSLFVLFGIWQVSVHVAESLSHLLSQLLSGLLGLKVLVRDILEIEIVDSESSRHNMGLVDVFDKRFDSSLFDEFLLVEAALGGDKVASDACYEEMGESVFLGKERITLLPVSLVLMTTAFLPAYFPWVMTTTLPVLKLRERRSTFCPWCGKLNIKK